jgi:hypothetical protein
VFTVVGGSGGTPTPTPTPQPALQITTSSLQKATVGASYTATLAAAGGGNLTWTLSAGSLPSGLTLGSNGVLSGTPNGAGGYTFTVRVSGGGRSASKQLGLLVVDKLTVSVPTDQTWEVRRPLQIAINAKGGTPGYGWKVTGTLPENTGFIGNQGNGSTSYLRGVPAQAGTFPIVLAVSDADGASAQVTVTLTVAPKLQVRTFGSCSHLPAASAIQVGVLWARFRLASISTPTRVSSPASPARQGRSASRSSSPIRSRRRQR